MSERLIKGAERERVAKVRAAAMMVENLIVRVDLSVERKKG